MEYRRLGATGLDVSVLGLGASPLGSVFRDIDEAEGHRTVQLALDLGLNLIDVSPFYGVTRAESVLGRALEGIPRERYYLATKVGRYDQAEFDFSAARTRHSVDESLRRLGVDHVDLIQCHDIEFGDLDQVIEETLPALREVVAAGKARFVGITGLPLHIFRYVLARAEVDCILSYCHYCLNDTSLADLLPDLTTRGVGVINASPLAMRLLCRAEPPAWHPAPRALQDAAAAARAACEARGVDLADLALPYACANPAVATTLVGTANPANLQRNVAALARPIDHELLAEVLAVLAPVHNLTWPSGRPENNG